MLETNALGSNWRTWRRRTWRCTRLLRETTSEETRHSLQLSLQQLTDYFKLGSKNVNKMEAKTIRVSRSSSSKDARMKNQTSLASFGKSLRNLGNPKALSRGERRLKDQKLTWLLTAPLLDNKVFSTPPCLTQVCFSQPSTTAMSSSSRTRIQWTTWWTLWMPIHHSRRTRTMQSVFVWLSTSWLQNTTTRTRSKFWMSLCSMVHSLAQSPKQFVTSMGSYRHHLP